MFALLQWYHFKSSMLQMIQKFLGFYIVLGYELMLTYCSLSGFNSASYINPWSLPAKAPEHFAIHPKEDEILFQSHHFSGTFAVKLFGEVNPIDFFPGKFLWYCWWNKSCDHQLTLVLYAIIYRVFIHSRWLAVFFFPSTLGTSRVMWFSPCSGLFGTFTCFWSDFRAPRTRP